MKNKKTIAGILLLILAGTAAIDYYYSLEYMLLLTIFLSIPLFFLLRKLWIIAREADYDNYLWSNYPQDYIDHINSYRKKEE